MAIRLEHIRISRGGPLREDFELEPGDLNLIYGRNETGKTYLVEALIRVLFSKGKRSHAAWDLREWDLKGRIQVLGLGSEPISFTTTGKKLEEFWTEESGMPPDLARLLVVKGGEVFLDSDADDGVGGQVLRNYLSGEGLLDGIGKRISATVSAAKVEDKSLQGAATGELRNRTQLLQDRTRIDALLAEVEERYASGAAHVLRSEIGQLEQERAGLELARRYRASVLYGDLEEQRRQQQAQPDQQLLAQLSEQLAIYETKAADVEAKAVTLADLDEKVGDFRWTEKALEAYREITRGEGGGETKPIFLVVALVSLAASVGAGLLGYTVPMLMCAVITAGLVGGYYWQTKKTLTSAGEGRELERLKEEFHRRFGVNLSERSTLEAQLEELRETHIKGTSLRNELENSQIELRQLKAQITAVLEPYEETASEPEAWRQVVSTLRQSLVDHEEKVRGLEKRLDALGVSEEDRLDDNPGGEWNKERFQELIAEMEGREAKLEEATGELELLRTHTLQELNRHDGDWENLIEELRDRRGEVAEDYRRTTADILGKIQVATVIEEFRKQENERISSGLKSEVVSAPLQAITGRYSAIRQDEDGTLLLLDEHDECPLSMASTGTREQVFLALRIGFASLLMKGEKGVLILDDAFQHSDWQRRNHCVQELLNLVAAGWQVFYFTMDDHIRDLFVDASQRLGDRFKKVDL
jgi:DNA repair exonuclease SbcCD ATPase subunit